MGRWEKTVQNGVSGYSFKDTMGDESKTEFYSEAELKDRDFLKESKSGPLCSASFCTNANGVTAVCWFVSSTSEPHCRCPLRGPLTMNECNE